MRQVVVNLDDYRKKTAVVVELPLSNIQVSSKKEPVSMACKKVQMIEDKFLDFVVY